ncbi:hypothetical protein [Stenotrophomonas muris]|uniref:hypothetical protein n=1 Tax=Stenotrophomonas muris TaxID=2963283 RepID=UPI00300E7073
MNKVERVADEPDWAFEGRKQYGVVEIRYQAHADSVAQLEAIRYRVSAVFGNEPAKAVDEVLAVLRRVRNEAINAVGHKRVLQQQSFVGNPYPTGQRPPAYENALKYLRTAESWIWAGEEGGDPAAQALATAVARAEVELKDFASMRL